jgi:hypothetical protein
VNQAQNNALVALPVIMTAPFVDPDNPDDNYMMVGFQCTPSAWITAHIWVAHVS